MWMIALIILMTDPNCSNENIVDGYDAHFGEGYYLQLIARFWMKSNIPQSPKFKIIQEGEVGYDPTCTKYLPPMAWLFGDLDESGRVDLRDLAIWSKLKYAYSDPPSQLLAIAEEWLHDNMD